MGLCQVAMIPCEHRPLESALKVLSTPTDTEAMDLIHTILDKEPEWSSEEIELVATVVMRTGRQIRTPEEHRNGPSA